MMKYVGSKASVFKHLWPFIRPHLSSETTYVEPFVGGGNSIAQVPHARRLGADANRFVVALLSAIRDGWVPPDISREEYDDIRANRDSYAEELVGWAGVGCSYSGKWFGGYAGRVRTKAGAVRDYIDEARRNCLKQAPKLQGADFRHSHFLDLDVPDGSLVYCDPPYANTLRYPGEFDTGKFWNWCRELSQFNTVLVSEYAAPEDWEPVWQGLRGSSLSANGSSGGRQTSVERLFVLSRKLES
ncbi:DNA adenine methylase [Mycobacterium phage CactusRose]|nr:DNA adenine methylase [Mycobacterium phage CactusRose]